MSDLKQRLKSDVIVHMKAGDKVELATLRNVLGEIETNEKSGKNPVEFTDQQIVSLLQKEAAKRRDTAKIYSEAGEAERAASELAEADVIDAYLPQPLSREEVEAIVDGVFAKQTADGKVPSMRDMGSIMKEATALVAGRFDGKSVSDMVRSRLS